VTPFLRRWLLRALVLAVALAACAQSSSSVAASVGDSEISVDRLQADVDLYGFLTAISGAPCGSPVPGETDESACARFALGNDIREELAKTYAQEHDVTVEDQAVQDAMSQLETGLGGAEGLKKELDDAGVSRTQVQALAERLLLVSAVQQAVVQERLDDATLRQAYQNQLATFTMVEVAHILVKDRADAERIAAEVTPKTFAATAKKESIDPGSASNGGSLGSMSEADFRARFDQTFVDAALALQPGEISRPVHTQFGWHVIYLKTEDIAPFDDVREQLLASQGGSVFADWFAEQLDATTVDVNPRFGRFDPKTGQVLPVRSTAEESGQTGATGGTGSAGSGSAPNP
jgi:parvulin-like peptidyl-prolyl isomerase